MPELLRRISAFFDTVLFRIGDTPVSTSTLVSVLLVIIGTFWLSRLLRRIAERTLTRKGGRPGVTGTVTAIIHYAVLFTGFGIALGTAGIDLTALFAAGAFFAVGLGFAMQSIAQNFVAGVILLAERTIKPGDILEVEGTVVKVAEMGIRASIGRTRDGEDLIIPNSTLIQTTVKNYTLRTLAFRIRATVGVVYHSDMELVKATLDDVAARANARWAVAGKEPVVLLIGFGDSSVNWEIDIWMDDPWQARPAISQLHQEIWAAFRQHGIVIAFPQLDVHLDAPVVDSFERLARGRVA